MIYKFEFSEQQMQVLNAAIVELPFKVAAPLVQDINRQLESQQKAPVEDETSTANHGG
jgi:hypothetical protein